MPNIDQNIRIIPRFNQKVAIPQEFKKYLWDEQFKAPLEKLVYRVLFYGNFNDLQKIFQTYPEVCLYVIEKYQDLHRGVKFWIKKWANEGQIIENSQTGLTFAE